MPKISIIVSLLLLALTGSAQLPVLQWAKAFQPDNNYNLNVYNNGRAIGVDKQGNVYSAGLFSNTVDMDPGAGVYDMTGGDPNKFGIFISKLDANGNFVWGKQVPTNVEFAEIDLKVDKEGNVYVASQIMSPADMDPGPGVLMMSPTGFKDAFVIKLNTNGDMLWVKKFGGPGDTGAESTKIEIDKDNNVILCGLFNNTVDFDPGPGTFNLTSTAHIQTFIVKLNSSGDLIWATQFGTSPVVYSGSCILDVKCDGQGNIYTTGYFTGACDFDPGSGVYTVTANSLKNGFIAKLSPGGALVWADRLANTTNDSYDMITPRAISIDGMGNIVATGWFNGTFDFDPGSGVSAVTSAGSDDCYILKITADGGFIWVERIGGTLSDTGNDLALDNDNNIYICGSFGPTVDYDPGPGDHTVNSPGYGPSAIVKLQSNGDFIYAALFESGNSSTLFRRMAVDNALNIYSVGFLSGSEDFDPGPGVYTLTTYEESPFVLKLGPCSNVIQSILDITDCNSYTLNNQTYDRSGTYTQTVPNKNGCYTIVTLNLTLNKKFTQQTKTICGGESFFAGGEKQNNPGTYIDTLQTWMGCDSIVTTILSVNPKPSPDLGPDKYLCSNSQLKVTPGSFTSYSWQNLSNSSNYIITAPGTYWVEVSNSFGCTATDTIVVPGISETPSNFLKATDSVCINDGLEILPLIPYSSYQWSTGETAGKIYVQQPGTYWLMVTNTDGCPGTESITVFEKKCITDIYVPSAFTPNNDGHNDVFKPAIFRATKQYRFVVYNRWGVQVFQTTDPQKGWNGNIAGISQPNGTFIWTCYYQFEGTEPKYAKGTVVLIR
ncbi:T9SS type B sorting domain-containing protein [Flavitalea flava]